MGIKRKGRYCYGEDLQLHQNHSKQCVAMTVEAYLLKGEGIEDYIRTLPLQCFLLAVKIPRTSTLRIDDEVVPNIIRYVVSNNGGELFKVMPVKGIPGQYKRANKLTDEYFNTVMEDIGPDIWDSRVHTKNQSKYEEERVIGINKQFKISLCNNLKDLNNADINYDFYIAEVMKIVNKFYR